MTWKDIKKNYVTSLFGLAMMLLTLYKYYETNEVNWSEVVTALGGLGLLAAKDSDKSHTQE